MKAKARWSLPDTPHPHPRQTKLPRPERLRPYWKWWRPWNKERVRKENLKGKEGDRWRGEVQREWARYENLLPQSSFPRQYPTPPTPELISTLAFTMRQRDEKSFTRTKRERGECVLACERVCACVWACVCLACICVHVQEFRLHWNFARSHLLENHTHSITRTKDSKDRDNWREFPAKQECGSAWSLWIDNLLI